MDHDNDILPMFKDNPERARQKHEKGSKIKFWEYPDLQLESIRLRVALCPVSGKYKIFFNRPSSEAQLLERPQWPGNVISMTVKDAKRLSKYMAEKNQELDDEPSNSESEEEENVPNGSEDDESDGDGDS